MGCTPRAPLEATAKASGASVGMAKTASRQAVRSASGRSIRITQGELGICGLVQTMRVTPGWIMPFSSMRWMLPRVGLDQKVAAASKVPLSTAITLCS